MSERRNCRSPSFPWRRWHFDPRRDPTDLARPNCLQTAAGRLPKAEDSARATEEQETRDEEPEDSSPRAPRAALLLSSAWDRPWSFPPWQIGVGIIKQWQFFA